MFTCSDFFEVEMSVLEYLQTVRENDDVILYFTFSKIKTLRVKKGETYQTHLGALRHNDIIGKQYGTKVNCAKGWVYVLHITPELWTVTLPHRTQILYTPDISMVLLQLEITCGSTVIESGNNL